MQWLGGADFGGSNEEFLRALFGDAWREVPVSSGKDSWGVRPAGVALKGFRREASNYFCVSLFNKTEKGRFVRQKRCFKAQCVLVVDDLGTKLNEEIAAQWLPQPTYVLETSPGNFQWGYKLGDGGETNPRKLRAIIDAIINNKELNPSLTDPGMVGLTRVARLPIGCNEKDAVIKANGGRAFAHVMHYWNPSLEYSCEEIAESIDVDLSESALENLGSEEDVTGGAVATRDAIAADDILKLFIDRGMVRNGSINDNGFIAVQCPWSAEHTDPTDDEAGYRPGKGGFQCHHGHCENRTMVHLREWVETERTPAELVVVAADAFKDAPLDGEVLDDLVDDLQTEHGFSDWIGIVSGNQFYNVRSGKLYSKEEFNLHSGIAARGAGGTRSAAALFLDGGGRCVEVVSYLPGKSLVSEIELNGVLLSCVNTWRSGNIPDMRLIETLDSDISPWLDHVRHIIPDDVARDLFLNWCASQIQTPGEKINWAFVLLGAQGTGKDLMLRPITRIIGHHNVSPVSEDNIQSQFTEYLQCQVCLLQELPPYGKRVVYDRLKAMVAKGNALIQINPKGRTPFYIPNIQNWFVFSNHDDALVLEKDDRRFFIYKSPAEIRGKEYFSDLADELASPLMLARIKNWLLRRDLGAFDRNATPPMTEAKADMLEASVDPLDEFVGDTLERGGMSGRSLIMVNEIMKLAMDNTAAITAPAMVRNRINVSNIGWALRRLGWVKIKERIRFSGDRLVVLWVKREAAGAFYSGLSGAAIEEIFEKDKARKAFGDGAEIVEIGGKGTGGGAEDPI